MKEHYCVLCKHLENKQDIIYCSHTDNISYSYTNRGRKINNIWVPEYKKEDISCPYWEEISKKSLDISINLKMLSKFYI